MTKKQTAKKTAPRRSPLPFVIIGVVLLAAIVAGAWYLSHSRPPGTVASGSPGAEPAHAEGSAGAPVVLEEFGDFQCPPCGAMFPEVERMRQDYGERVRFVFREFPLINVHPHALLAAHAAEAAGLQGKFWEMHRELFTNQQAWSRSQDPTPLFETYARSAGLDVDRFRRDLGSPETDARVVADRDRGKSVGVESTPTFYINGRKMLPSQTTGKGLREEIDRILGGG
ncbi:MAG TPA: thioredoxin domain-containing protein [Pyrinomonadaceae bacterium]|jgi:protein-disulfide isomerase